MIKRIKEFISLLKKSPEELRELCLASVKEQEELVDNIYDSWLNEDSKANFKEFLSECYPEKRIDEEFLELAQEALKSSAKAPTSKINYLKEKNPELYEKLKENDLLELYSEGNGMFKRTLSKIMREDKRRK